MSKKLPEAIAYVEELKAEQYPDQHIIYAAQERVNIWRQQVLWTGLLVALKDLLKTNPYPGEQLRLLSVACKLMPEVTEHEWCRIFDYFNIDRTEKCYFEVEAEELDIESIEQQLIELMTDDNVIPASALMQVLHCTQRSKQYIAAKAALEQRGWYWYRRRKIPTSVIHPPAISQ